MAARDPVEHRLISQKGAHISWANTTDPTARTAPGRQAFHDEFQAASRP